jgi:dCMP deaminase
MTRPGWDDYFMEITRVVATRSTCSRRQVGAVLVRDKHILSSGYNGAPRGLDHCLEIGCLREQMGIPPGQRQELCRGLHAEQNAIIQAAYQGVETRGAIIYVTHQPCVTCAKMIINAGIVRVVYAGSYPDEMSLALLGQARVELFHHPEP